MDTRRLLFMAVLNILLFTACGEEKPSFGLRLETVLHVLQIRNVNLTWRSMLAHPVPYKMA